MKKIVLCFLMLVVAGTILTGCNTETSVSLGLKAEDIYFATIEEEKAIKASGTAFKQGDVFAMIFENVSGFKKDEDGLNWMDMDMQILDSDKKVILEEKEMLGENGKIDLKDNIAEAPQGYCDTKSLEPGKYDMKITLYDKIGGGKIEKAKSFTIK